MEWKHLAFVALGGGLGSVLRAYLSILLRGGFPWATLLVNVAGCFLIGLLMRELDENRAGLRFLLVTGFCGGFTTFSAFGAETLQLIRTGQYVNGAGNVALTFVLCFVAVALGHQLSKG